MTWQKKGGPNFRFLTQKWNPFPCHRGILPFKQNVRRGKHQTKIPIFCERLHQCRWFLRLLETMKKISICSLLMDLDQNHNIQTNKKKRSNFLIDKYNQLTEMKTQIMIKLMERLNSLPLSDQRRIEESWRKSIEIQCDGSKQLFFDGYGRSCSCIFWERPRGNRVSL